MIEILICNNCTASVSTEQELCQYCGNDYRISGESAEILDFVEQIDRSFIKAEPTDLIYKINNSKFKDHPMVRFRKSKVLLIEYMTNDSILDNSEFIEILKIIKEISEVNNNYWFEFILYLSVLIPSSCTKLFLSDFLQIKKFIEDNGIDNDQIIINKLMEQVLITKLGDQFFKEYKYYKNDNNFVNNPAFINKKNKLIDQYMVEYNNLNNQIK